MDEPDQPPAPWSAGEKAGAALLLLLALGLGLVSADILSGGRVFRRGCTGCGEPSEGPVDVVIS